MSANATTPILKVLSLNGFTAGTGAQHVEQSIASGFSMITRNRYGASLRYSLVAPAHDSAESRTLRASDGTLAYAQYLLSQGKQAEHSTQSS